MLHVLLLVPLLLLAPAVQDAAAPASFTALGHPRGGFLHGDALCLSADGSAIAGQVARPGRRFSAGASAPATVHVFLWTASDGFTPDEGFPRDMERSRPRALSPDGALLVGDLYRGWAAPQAFRWGRAGRAVELPRLREVQGTSSALDASSDGAVIVGWTESKGGHEAVRWTDSRVLTLGDLQGGENHSEASLVSHDGRIIAGTGTHEHGQEAFLWTEAGGMVALGDLPGGECASAPFGMSQDGAVIVGQSASDCGTEAFSWTAAAGLQRLGDLPGDAVESCACGVSADGARIVGYNHTPRGFEAVLWERDDAPRPLRELLLAAGAWEVEGVLRHATAISDDGRVIAGHGVDPAGNTQAWRAALP